MIYTMLTVCNGLSRIKHNDSPRNKFRMLLFESAGIGTFIHFINYNYFV